MHGWMDGWTHWWLSLYITRALDPLIIDTLCMNISGMNRWCMCWIFVTSQNIDIRVLYSSLQLKWMDIHYICNEPIWCHSTLYMYMHLKYNICSAAGILKPLFSNPRKYILTNPCSQIWLEVNSIKVYHLTTWTMQTLNPPPPTVSNRNTVADPGGVRRVRRTPPESRTPRRKSRTLY